MTLGWIVLGCLAGGLASVVIAFGMTARLAPRRLARLVPYAAGVLLASALLDILPAAFEQGRGSYTTLFGTLLAGLVGFHLLERAALWRHAHHGADAHDHAHAQPVTPALVLTGDACHNFVDGVLIAAAFLADPWVGVTTTLAVIAHEIPQELGDFVLLLEAGWSRAKALAANAACGLASVAGGVTGWLALEATDDVLPHVLTIAAASFLYIAVADLLPLLQRRQARDGFVMQCVALGTGIATVPLVGHWLH